MKLILDEQDIQGLKIEREDTLWRITFCGRVVFWLYSEEACEHLLSKLDEGRTVLEFEPCE